MDSIVTLIIPAYNENIRIQSATDSADQLLKKITYDYEIIIAEDGSTDGTYEISTRMASQTSKISLLHSDLRCGKGNALNRAIKAAKGDVIAFMDADMSTDISFLPLLLDAVGQEGFDMAIGSRLIPGGNVDRSRKRSIASKLYNSAVRLILRSKIYDHQCGFKAFQRGSILAILDQIKDGRWFWDTEMLVRAQRDGYKIKEIPVSWREPSTTTFELAPDGYEMGSKIIKLWLDLNREKKSLASCKDGSVDEIMPCTKETR
jgi:glycosyltransferase involved in cell wall biosynthesis